MKILLLTAGLNNDKNSSWLVYAKFISFLRANLNATIEIICFTPSLRLAQKTLNEKTFTTFLRDKIITALFNRVSRKYSWWITNYYAGLYSKRIINHIQKNNIERLWVHTDLLTMLILEKVSKQIELPFHLTIYDDPFTNRFYEPFKDRIDSVLKKLFLGAKSIDTPTIMLAEHYRTKGYINKSCKISESLVGTFKEQVQEPIIRKEVKKIGLAGSIYGVDAFNSFLEALGDTLRSANVEFHLITNVPKLYLKFLENKYPAIPGNTLIKTFIPETILANKLQDYDLLYLPMMFDKQSRFKTNTSFPSKTHNYLASGVPVIVHAPESSSLYQFFKDNEIGHLINSLDSQTIIESFEKLLCAEFRMSLSKDIQDFNKTRENNSHVKSLYETMVSE